MPPEDPPTPDPFDWRAEMGREFGLRLGTPPPLPTAELAENTAPAWMAEFLREHAPAAEERVTFPPLSPHDIAQTLRRYSAAGAFRAELVPPDFEAYRRLCHAVYEAPRDRLARTLARIPALHAAWHAWRPGAEERNLNIAYEVFDRVSAPMGEIYRFHPAPLGYTPGMDGVSGLYDPKQRRVMLAAALLHERVEELFATVVHEQIHKLQHELDMRVDRPSNQPLSVPERCLVFYWRREEPRRGAMAAKGLADVRSGRGDRAYRRIGKEYQAYDTEEYVVSALADVFSRG